eukprot:TRINITY_DN4942_c0_g1_i1.p1 TRINITY_DN4942_c0_g1~~TRINITY_DN4942_c0_g1_i1.p1  ORF type:complete len:689 (-),score=120.25 TRINITY_DN4942_c0_g1_i1:8-2074(-)
MATPFLNETAKGFAVQLAQTDPQWVHAVLLQFNALQPLPSGDQLSSDLTNAFEKLQNADTEEVMRDVELAFQRARGERCKERLRAEILPLIRQLPRDHSQVLAHVLSLFGNLFLSDEQIFEQAAGLIQETAEIMELEDQGDDEEFDEEEEDELDEEDEEWEEDDDEEELGAEYGDEVPHIENQQIDWLALFHILNDTALAERESIVTAEGSERGSLNTFHRKIADLVAVDTRRRHEAQMREKEEKECMQILEAQRESHRKAINGAVEEEKQARYAIISEEGRGNASLMEAFFRGRALCTQAERDRIERDIKKREAEQERQRELEKKNRQQEEQRSELLEQERALRASTQKVEAEVYQRLCQGFLESMPDEEDEDEDERNEDAQIGTKPKNPQLAAQTAEEIMGDNQFTAYYDQKEALKRTILLEDSEDSDSSATDRSESSSASSPARKVTHKRKKYPSTPPDSLVSSQCSNRSKKASRSSSKSSSSSSCTAPSKQQDTAANRIAMHLQSVEKRQVIDRPRSSNKQRLGSSQLPPVNHLPEEPPPCATRELSDGVLSQLQSRQPPTGGVSYNESLAKSLILPPPKQLRVLPARGKIRPLIYESPTRSTNQLRYDTPEPNNNRSLPAMNTSATVSNRSSRLSGSVRLAVRFGFSAPRYQPTMPTPERGGTSPTKGKAHARSKPAAYRNNR